MASARGAGEIERAWNLAVAGWVRAGRGQKALRSDLDRLVLQGVIPDLAASRAGHTPNEDLTIWIMAGLAGGMGNGEIGLGRGALTPRSDRYRARRSRARVPAFSVK